MLKGLGWQVDMTAGAGPSGPSAVRQVGSLPEGAVPARVGLEADARARSN